VPAALLQRFDIHPHRFQLLVDLFNKLGTRREFPLGGGNAMDLKLAEVLCFGVTSIIGVVLTFGTITPAPYLTIFIAWTAFVLLMVLAPEIAYTLINPIEGLVLAHHPINGATYTAAKLVRLFGLFLRFGPKMNIVPALAASVLLKEARWFYALNHMLAITVTGLLVVLLCCSVFGLLIRFVPPARLKGLMQGAQIVLIVAFVGFRFLSMVPQLIRRVLPDWVVAALPSISDLIRVPARMFLFGHSVEPLSHPFAALSVGVAMAGLLVFGLRSLSVDYLIRVHSIVHGRTVSRVKWRRSRVGELIAGVSGGQVSRAAFEYVRRLMLRDWEFMRSAAGLLPFLVGVLVLLITGPSPFSVAFSVIHVAPHAIGILFATLASRLVYGTEYKAAWIFLVVPNTAFRQFARGVHMSLWLPLVVIPHLVAFVVQVWRWGLWEAGAFVLFSASVGSLYLGLDLRKIDGVPFSRQPGSSRGIEADQILFLIVRVVIAAISVVVQHFLVFRSPMVALAAAVFIGYAAYLVTTRSLNHLDVSMRYHLSRLSSGASLYEEVG
jgi:hypothetical protein